MSNKVNNEEEISVATFSGREIDSVIFTDTAPIVRISANEAVTNGPQIKGNGKPHAVAKEAQISVSPLKLVLSALGLTSEDKIGSLILALLNPIVESYVTEKTGGSDRTFLSQLFASASSTLLTVIAPALVAVFGDVTTSEEVKTKFDSSVSQVLDQFDGQISARDRDFIFDATVALYFSVHTAIAQG